MDLGCATSANGGTLFLDELAEMSLHAQANLLRALQERKITRLGAKQSINVDIRIVAATNKDLLEEIKKGNFREELYYRLNVLHIKMPSLQEIKEDIPVIAKHFLSEMLKKINKENLKFSEEALKCLTDYSWPGNVRELENEVKRASIMAEGDYIERKDLSDHIQNSIKNNEIFNFDNENQTLNNAVEQLEKKMILDALDKTDGNKEKASRLLGITRQGLFNKIKRYKLE